MLLSLLHCRGAIATLHTHSLHPPLVIPLAHLLRGYLGSRASLRVFGLWKVVEYRGLRSFLNVLRVTAFAAFAALDLLPPAIKHIGSSAFKLAGALSRPAALRPLLSPAALAAACDDHCRAHTVVPRPAEQRCHHHPYGH